MDTMLEGAFLQLVQRFRGVHGETRTARGRRLTVLRDMFSSYQQFEAVEVQDITADDLSHALAGKSRAIWKMDSSSYRGAGVGAVVHVASPLYGRAAPEETIKVAVYPSRNVPS